MLGINHLAPPLVPEFWGLLIKNLPSIFSRHSNCLGDNLKILPSRSAILKFLIKSLIKMDSHPLTLKDKVCSRILRFWWRSIFFGLGSHFMWRSQSEQISFWLCGAGAGATRKLLEPHPGH